MKITNLQLKILDEVVEDYTQLWEIEEVVKIEKEELAPGLSRRIAVAAILDLANQGLIEFFVGTSFGGEEKLLSKHEIPDDLTEDQYWNPELPIRVPSIQVGATQKGMALSYGGPEKRSQALKAEKTEPGEAS